MTQLEKEIQSDIVKLLETVGAVGLQDRHDAQARRPSGNDADAWDSRPGSVRAGARMINPSIGAPSKSGLR